MMTLGNKYIIQYVESVVKEDIPNLPKTARQMIQRAIEQCLMVDPIGFGKPLRYSLKGHRRLRVGDYRVVFRIETENRVVIVAIKHRKDIYEDF